jgi:hypothetical protein
MHEVKHAGQGVNTGEQLSLTDSEAQPLNPPYSNNRRGDKMTVPFTRWTPQEYTTVGSIAGTLVAAGLPLAEAYYRAQKEALPRPRWRTQREIERLANDSKNGPVLKKYLPMGTKVSTFSAPKKSTKLYKDKVAERGKSPIQWTQGEWALIAREADRILKRGKFAYSDNRLIFDAQHVLPADRQRSRSSVVNGHLGTASRMLEDGRRYNLPAELSVEKPAPAPKREKTIQQIGAQGHTKWSRKEWAFVARRVQAMRKDGDERGPALIVSDAQEVLPPDRRRKRSSVQSISNAILEGRLKEADALIWTLPEADPYSEPAPAPEAAPAPIAQAVAEFVNVPAPMPQPRPQPGHFADAAHTFADVMSAAMGDLLAAHERHVLSALDSNVSKMAHALGAALTQQIERGLKQMVVDTLQAELGGPVTPPSASPVPPVPEAPAVPPVAPPVAAAAAVEQAQAPAPAVYPASVMARIEEHEDADKLKVDLLGMFEPQITEIKRAFNGGTSLRFIPQDHLNHWVPRAGAEVILNAKSSAVVGQLKCARYHIKPIVIKGTAMAAIHAIEALHQNHGTADTPLSH